MSLEGWDRSTRQSEVREPPLACRATEPIEACSRIARGTRTCRYAAHEGRNETSVLRVSSKDLRMRYKGCQSLLRHILCLDPGPLPGHVPSDAYGDGMDLTPVDIRHSLTLPEMLFSQTRST